MRTLTSALFMLVIFGAWVGCQQQGNKIDLSKVREAIDAQNAKFQDAIQQGDATTIASLYTEDAKLMPPNHKSIQGRAGIQQYWGMMMQMGVGEVALSTVEVSGSSNFVYEVGTYAVAIQAHGTEFMRDNGKYLVVWKHDDTEDAWKLQIDIWNSNAQMPAPAMSEK